MAIEVTIELKKEKVGTQWLITSPQLPGLYVADADLAKAEAAVPAAIEMLEHMAKRRKRRDEVNRIAEGA